MTITIPLELFDELFPLLTNPHGPNDYWGRLEWVGNGFDTYGDDQAFVL